MSDSVRSQVSRRLSTNRYKSPYLYFLDDFRTTFTDEQRRNITNVAKMGGAAWHRLSAEEKRPYEERSEQMRQAAIDAAAQKKAASNPPKQEYKRQNTDWKNSNVNINQEKGSKLFYEVDLEEFRCPITLNFMDNPVIASDGKSYERDAIEAILKHPNPLSPLTREKLTQNLTPWPPLMMKHMESVIEVYRETKPEVYALYKNTSTLAKQLTMTQQNRSAVCIQKVIRTYTARRKRVASLLSKYNSPLLLGRRITKIDYVPQKYAYDDVYNKVAKLELDNEQFGGTVSIQLDHQDWDVPIGYR